MNRERGGALDAREEPACAGPGVSAAWPSRGRAGCPSVRLPLLLPLSQPHGRLSPSDLEEEEEMEGAVSSLQH